MNIFILLSMLIPIALFIGFRYIAFKMRRSNRRRFAQRDSKGRPIEETTLAKLGAGTLPTDTGLIAGLGTKGEARQSLNESILRPSIGLRLLSIGLSSVMLAYLWGLIHLPGVPKDVMAGVPYAEWVKAGLSLIIVYSVFYILFYEVRYDTFSLSAPNWFFVHREYTWKDLVSLKDNGHYLYILRFEDGRKAEVQKYLVGIREFLSYANDRVAANRAS